MVPKRKLSNDSLWITLLKSFSQKSASWASSAVDKCDSKFGCRVIFKASLMYLLVRFSFTLKALWLVFVSISASQSGQSKMVSFFLPIRSQIVQESRIFSRFTFGILLIKPGVVLLTTQVTNKTDPNFPSLYARCQTLICTSTDFCRVAAPRVSSDHPGMKNISGEVSIFCLWTNWIHLVTCSKIEFRELHCCSRCALDKIFEIYTFDRCSQGWSGQKSFLACGDAKEENWRTTKLFLKHVSETLFVGKK